MVFTIRMGIQGIKKNLKNLRKPKCAVKLTAQPHFTVDNCFVSGN